MFSAHLDGCIIFSFLLFMHLIHCSSLCFVPLECHSHESREFVHVHCCSCSCSHSHESREYVHVHCWNAKLRTVPTDLWTLSKYLLNKIRKYCGRISNEKKWVVEQSFPWYGSQLVDLVDVLEKIMTWHPSN